MISKQNTLKRFALIGVGGYIATRHLKAIKDTGNSLVAALDPNDSVGIIDSYFPESDFFIEFERFDRHLDKLRRQGSPIDYVSICSPNYLHDSHIRFALRNRATAICEKPLVLNPWNVEALQELEKETGQRVNTILQLRLHPTIIEFKKKIDNGPNDKIYDLDLTYITSRGHWYNISWKGDMQKSGGIATNIGVHFFDMLTWIFGDVEESIVHISEKNVAAGYLRLKKARVRWFLSVNSMYLPENTKLAGKSTYRSITCDGEELEFSEGFTELHTDSYKQIIAGNGFGLNEAKNSIETVFTIRNAQPVGLKGDYHPFSKRV